MTGMNARLNKNVETVFLMASEKQQFISSRFVKEIAFLDGDVNQFISSRVETKLQEKKLIFQASK
jgi:pantetheine-phosphate adenylyltransferase